MFILLLAKHRIVLMIYLASKLNVTII